MPSKEVIWEIFHSWISVQLAQRVTKAIIKKNSFLVGFILLYYLFSPALLLPSASGPAAGSSRGPPLRCHCFCRGYGRFTSTSSAESWIRLSRNSRICCLNVLKYKIVGIIYYCHGCSNIHIAVNIQLVLVLWVLIAIFATSILIEIRNQCIRICTRHHRHQPYNSQSHSEQPSPSHMNNNYILSIIIWANGPLPQMSIALIKNISIPIYTCWRATRIELIGFGEYAHEFQSVCPSTRMCSIFSSARRA